MNEEFEDFEDLDQDVIPGGVETAPDQFSLPPKGVDAQEAVEQTEQAGTSSFLEKLRKYIVRTVFNAQFNQVRFEVNVDTALVAFEATARRQYLIIQNRSTSVIFINFGEKANDKNGIELAAGASYEPTIAPVNSVHIIGSAAGPGTQVVVGIQGLV